MNLWTQSSLTESYWGVRDVDGHFRGMDESPCTYLGVNTGSSLPGEGRSSGVLETVVGQTVVR